MQKLDYDITIRETQKQWKFNVLGVIEKVGQENCIEALKLNS